MATDFTPIAIAAVGCGLLLREFDVAALRIPVLDYLEARRFSLLDQLIGAVPIPDEPKGCIRLKGPIGAEDAVVWTEGGPPMIITGELDAGVHEFTDLETHGTSASTSPRGTLWAIDRLSEPTPRLTALEVPLPADVSTLHTHGLGLHGDVLFAVNHAFQGGGERIERWRITRGAEPDGPPLVLMHLGSVTGHGGDEVGEGAWSFTSMLNAAINDLAPVGINEFYMTQFLDAPASLEGAGSGTLEEYVSPPEGRLAASYRWAAARLGIEIHAKTLLPRLRRSRIWHCYCASGDTGSDCARTACEPVGPPGACWNGITSRPLAPGEQPPAPGARGILFVNDIFRRIVVEFAIVGEGARASLKQLRQFRAPFLVDNVHLDASGEALWVGAVGVSHQSFWGGLDALRANASAAHTAATAAGNPTPRPHLHLRPSEDSPPQPPMPSGALHIDLASGKVSAKLVQRRQLAAISWSHGVGDRIFMGSPWDDGVLVCPRDP